MLAIPKVQQSEKAIEKGIIHSYLRMPDMVVKEAPTMEALIKEIGTTTEHLGEMTIMEELQMIMIQMIMMTMITVAMMTLPVVMDTHGQAAATLNLPI